MGKVIRWAIFLSWLVVCFHSGGIRMTYYGFLMFGLLAVLWYTIIDTWHRLASAVRRPNVTVDSRSVNIFPQPEQARRGAPTTDDFAGMIEYREHAK